MARALVIFVAAALALFGACSECPYVEQTIYVAKDDPELAGLISDCNDHVPSTTDPRCASGAVASDRFDCACVPLCERVYAIVVPDPSREPLTECLGQVSTATATSGQEAVSIKYRSRCP